MTGKATVSITVQGSSPPPSGMAVQLTWGDGSFSGTFTQANAIQEDDFHAVDGSFVMSSFVSSGDPLKQPMPHPAFRVRFRPDQNSDRREWVFEMSDATNKSGAAPVDLGAYTATLYDNGIAVHTEKVPMHNWGGRWRWFNRRRPDLAGVTVAGLVAAKQLPFYDTSGLVPNLVPMNPATYTPMTTAGMVEGMGQTGERPEIGLFARPAADLIILGKSRSTLQAWCEGLNTFGICHRDLTTGAPIDLVAYPKASSYSPPGNAAPYVQATHPKMPSGATLAYDKGHSPNLLLTEYLLCGDPYLLEMMQFQANADLLENPNASRYSDSGRYWGWACRNWFCLKQAMAKAPAQGWPRWLFAATVPDKVLGNFLAQMTTWISAGAPQAATFHSPGASLGSKTGPSIGSFWVAGAYIDYWQVEMQGCVTGWMVECGQSQWAAVHKFLLQGTIARTNKIGGGLRSHPTSYMIDARRNAQLAAPLAATEMSMQVTTPGQFSGSTQVTVDSESMTVTASPTSSTWPITARAAKPGAHALNAPVMGPFFTSFADQGVGNLAIHAASFPFMAGDPTGMEMLYFVNAGGGTYPSYTLSALRMAYANGSITAADLDVSVSWLLAQMQGVIGKNHALQVDPKWCLGRRP